MVKNQTDQIQAHYLALAGIEKAKAIIYQDAKTRKRGAQNHNRDIYDASSLFKDVPLGRGQFRVFRQASRDEGGKIFYGVSDEESRLNLNTASTEELAKLDNMTPENLAAIQDWRDEDNQVSPSGAESDYYASLQPPRRPRNGPFQTTRELMMVRGVTPELFLGEDANGNGLLDPEEDDGNESFPPDNRDGLLDAGWSELLTVNSSVANVNAAGEDRVNVQTADENTLAQVRGLSRDLAKAIVAYRAQKKLENLADLLDVAPVNQPNQPRDMREMNRPPLPASSARNPAQPGAAAPNVSGPPLISENLLMEIGDDVTVSEKDQPGAVNINTASAAVLACLPSVSRDLAQAIVSYRKSAGFFPNTACLLKVNGMTREIFRQLAPKVSARSENFRILSEGQVKSSGARKRLQVVVRLGASDVETLSYREDL